MTLLTVKVTTREGQTQIYQPGDTLPMTGFGEPIDINDLFGKS